jgi:hypothetical protein
MLSIGEDLVFVEMVHDVAVDYIYINDMPEMAKSSETKLFADDSLLFRTINNQADSILLQNDLTSLQDWEDKWQMSFNAKKCQVIRITPKNRPPLPTTYKQRFCKV